MNRSLGSAVVHQLTGSAPSLVTLSNGEVAQVFWVTIEGPIGAGKTELTKVLVPRLEAEFGKDRIFFVPEPIEELMQDGLFQRYQRDPARWAFEFQTTCFDLRTDYFNAGWDAMCEKLAQQGRVPQDGLSGRKTAILISERSIVSDTCFMRVQYRQGHCDEDTLNRYLKLNAKWRALYKGIAPGLVIYCRAGADMDKIVDLCQQRIHERKREAEEDLVTPEYNRCVLEEHERLFGPAHGAIFFASGFAKEVLAIPVITVDTTENYRDDPSVALKKSGELLDVIRLAVQSMPEVEPIVRLDRGIVEERTLLGGAGPVYVDVSESSQ